MTRNRGGPGLRFRFRRIYQGSNFRTFKVQAFISLSHWTWWKAGKKQKDKKRSQNKLTPEDLWDCQFGFAVLKWDWSLNREPRIQTSKKSAHLGSTCWLAESPKKSFLLVWLTEVYNHTYRTKAWNPAVMRAKLAICTASKKISTGGE